MGVTAGTKHTPRAPGLPAAPEVLQVETGGSCCCPRIPNTGRQQGSVDAMPRTEVEGSTGQTAPFMVDTCALCCRGAGCHGVRNTRARTAQMY